MGRAVRIIRPQIAFRTGNVRAVQLSGKIGQLPPIVAPVPVDISPLSTLCRSGWLSERRECLATSGALEAVSTWRERNDALCAAGLKLSALRMEMLRQNVLEGGADPHGIVMRQYRRALSILDEAGKRPAAVTADVVLYRMPLPDKLTKPQEFEAKLASLRIGLGILLARWPEVEKAGNVVILRKGKR